MTINTLDYLVTQYDRIAEALNTQSCLLSTPGRAMSKSELLKAIDLIIEYNKLNFRYISRKFDLEASDEIASQLQFIQNQQKMLAPAHFRLVRTLLLTQPHLAQITPENAKILGEKKRKAKAHWQKIREHVVKRHAKPTALARRLKISSEFIGKHFNNIESTLLNHAINRTENHYHAILRQHQKNILWLRFMLDIYKTAKVNVDTVLEKIEQDHEVRKQMYRDVALGIVKLSLSPLGLDKLFEPILQALRMALPQDEIGQIIETSLFSDEVHEIIKKSCALMFPRFDSVTAGANTRNTTNESLDPIKLIELSIEYCEHKANGVLNDAYQLFNSQIDEPNPLLGNISPEEFIHSLVHQQIASLKKEISAEDWEIYCENDFARFKEKILNKSEHHLAALIDNLFSQISGQYTQFAEATQYADLINRICFDDSKTGISAVNDTQRKELKAQLSRSIETTMLLDFARAHHHFFGLEAHDQCIPVDLYGLYPGYETQQIGLQIVERHMTDHPDESEMKEKLFVHERAKSALNYLGSAPFKSQLHRQELLDKLYHLYDPHTLEATLKTQIQTYAQSHQIKLRNSKNMGIDNRCRESENRWIPENQLAEKCKDVLGEHLAFCEEEKEQQLEEMRTLKEISYWTDFKNRAMHQIDLDLKNNFPTTSSKPAS